MPAQLVCDHPHVKATRQTPLDSSEIWACAQTRALPSAGAVYLLSDHDLTDDTTVCVRLRELEVANVALHYVTDTLKKLAHRGPV